jgi:hypothetical protein
MVALGESPEREAECSSSDDGRFVGLGCVRSACRSFSSVKIETNVSSRKLWLRRSVVGGRVASLLFLLLEETLELVARFTNGRLE